MFHFLSLTKASSLYNFHSHTQFCDGRASMEDFARAATAAGFRHYGFTPHSPLPIQSPCNMDMDAVPEFLDEVQRLRREYPSLHFYAGMEVDYLGPEWGPTHEYFRGLPLDYRIGSVHFVPTQEGEPVDVDGSPERFAVNLRQRFHGDLEYVVRTFYRQSLDMVRAGGFDMIGHFDKIGLNASSVQPDIEQQPWYQDLVDELVEEIRRSGVTVEINTKAYAKWGRFFPEASRIAQLKALGVPIVVNSDAHYPDLINAGRDEALRLLGL